MRKLTTAALVAILIVAVSGGIQAGAAIQTVPPVDRLSDVFRIPVGAHVSLEDGPGSGPGGEFILQASTDGTADTSIGTYRTFCVEHTEILNFQSDYLIYGSTEFRMHGAGEYYFIDSLGKIIDGDDFGGLRDAALLDALRTSPGYDEYLKRFQQAQYLYTQFFLGTLDGYDYDNSGGASGRADSADTLQPALWYLMGDTSVSYPNLPLPDPNASSGNGLGDFLILNLVDADTGEEATDMFGVGPHNLPEPASLVLLALGAIWALARR